jgi:transcription-repair coupling factor (superfamily II helicase)
MTFAFRANKFANPAGLASWLTTTKGRVKLRPDHKLAVVADMSVPERVRLAKEVLSGLSRVATQARAA